MSDCLFCKIVAGEIPSSAVLDSDEIYAFHDINPVAPTHVLLVPKKHLASLDTTGPEDTKVLGELVARATDLARELGLNEKGYRLVINTNAQGGQEVYHLHVHLIGGRQMSWPPG